MKATAAAPPGALLRPQEVTQRSGSNFLAGFACLEKRRREGMTVIYAFCRVVDDAVDAAPDPATARAHLQFWRSELTATAAGAATTPVGKALQATMQEFGVPAAPLEALLDGVAMDIEPHSFADEAELRLYCERVASAVGFACLPVLGATGPAATAFADHLGKALQLTNILRDLRADALAGRVYVPRTWLAEHAVDPSWLRDDDAHSSPAANAALTAMCARFVREAEAEFGHARTHLRSLARAARRALVPARIMGAIYRDLLRRLAARGGDLRGGRVRVPRLRKLWLALGVWAGVRA
jgi:phytoene synthase